jgi:hypothetical protein
MPLTASDLLTALDIEVQANLEPLKRQPIFIGLPDFLEGTIGGSVALERGEASSLSGSMELRGATIADRIPLPDATARLDVTVSAGERLGIVAPLRLESVNHGVSDLRFEGQAVRSDGATQITASLTGERLVVPDILRFAELMQPIRSEAAWAGEGSSRRRPESGEGWSQTAIDKLRERRDTEPAWGRSLTGRASLDLGTVELRVAPVHGLRGQVDITPAAVTLSGAEASFLGAAFTLDGLLAFETDADQPYNLRVDAAFTGLDLGELFRRVQPDELPLLEGRFEVHAGAKGRGRNLADLGVGALSSMRVSGRNGVYRGLAGRYGLARTGAKVVGFLALSRQLKAIGRLMEELEALRFDTFDVELARETPRRFAITDFRLASPLIRIDGGGGIELQPGALLPASPVDARMDLATAGDLSILFEGLGLVGKEDEPDGFRPLTRPVTVGGTVAEPDTSDFYAMLDQAAEVSSGIAGVAMRRINSKLQKGD